MSLLFCVMTVSYNMTSVFDEEEEPLSGCLTKLLFFVEQPFSYAYVPY